MTKQISKFGLDTNPKTEHPDRGHLIGELYAEQNTLTSVYKIQGRKCSNCVSCIKIKFSHHCITKRKPVNHLSICHLHKTLVDSPQGA